jgi:hypothetical protein
MKINYSKLEVFTLGIDDVETARIADAFNCKVGKFPMKYLGLPISYKRLSKEELSYGGRSILINSSLTSIPMYTMGFYWLHEGTQKRLDSARGRFFL